LKLKDLILLLALISCEKEPENVNFKFINASDYLIDTLFLNNTGTGGFLFGPDAIIRLDIGDTTDFINLDYSSMPLMGKAVIGPKSYIGYFAYGTYDPTNPGLFDPGNYWITITDFDTISPLIGYDIILK
jgi:hypothetical protein